MDLEVLKAFFFWWFIIDMAVYLFSVIMVLLLKDWMSGLHTKLFGISETVAKEVIYRYIATFKIMVIVFNFSPWIALVILT